MIDAEKVEVLPVELLSVELGSVGLHPVGWPKETEDIGLLLETKGAILLENGKNILLENDGDNPEYGTYLGLIDGSIITTENGKLIRINI